MQSPVCGFIQPQDLVIKSLVLCILNGDHFTLALKKAVVASQFFSRPALQLLFIQRHLVAALAVGPAAALCKPASSVFVSATFSALEASFVRQLTHET